MNIENEAKRIVGNSSPSEYNVLISQKWAKQLVEQGIRFGFNTLATELKKIKSKPTTGFTYLGEVTMYQNEGFNEAVKQIESILKKLGFI